MNRADQISGRRPHHTLLPDIARQKPVSPSRNKKCSAGVLILIASLTSLSSGLVTMQAHAIPAANALPSGESVVNGIASFNRSIPNRLIVRQTTDKLVTNWDSFDIGSAAKVTFIQPSRSSLALNRVSSASASQIFGLLNANGQVFLVNPNGILFGAGSQVRAAGVVASVYDVSDADIKAGNYRFTRTAASTAQVDNQGSIRANSGAVLLLAPQVSNSGSIIATGGDIALINADQVQLAGGVTSVTQASGISDAVLSSGRLEAHRLGVTAGRIVLQADQSQTNSDLTLSGYLKADDAVSVTAANIDIGSLTTTTDTALNASHININDVFNLQGESSLLAISGTYSLNGSSAKINLLGSAAGFKANGFDYVVLRDISQLQAVGTDAASLAGHYVLAGNINAAATVTWNNAAGFQPIGTNATPFSGILDGLGHSLSALRIRRPTESVALIAYAQDAVINNINLRNASISGHAAAGLLYYANNSTVDNSSITGNIYSKQLAGDSNRQQLAAGLVGINEQGVISNSHAQVTIHSVVKAVDEALGSAGGLVGFNSGTISNSDAAGTIDAIGLVGGLVAENSGTVRDSHSTAQVNGLFHVGGLIGSNSGVVTTSSASGNVLGSSAYVGGLVGSNSGSISNSNATANVGNDGANGMDTGGLVGLNTGSVAGSYATGNVVGSLSVGGLIGYGDVLGAAHSTVSQSYATGDVRGRYHVGGLVGQNAGEVANSYATGAVDGAQYAGGLIGWTHAGVVSNSYATGSVAGQYAVGALFGRAENNTLTNSYWNTDSATQPVAIGQVPIGMSNTLIDNLTGLTGTQMKKLSSYAGWDISADPAGNSIWYIEEGRVPPALR